jgi:hypothetical protein
MFSTIKDICAAIVRDEVDRMPPWSESCPGKMYALDTREGIRRLWRGMSAYLQSPQVTKEARQFSAWCQPLLPVWNDTYAHHQWIEEHKDIPCDVVVPGHKSGLIRLPKSLFTLSTDDGETQSELYSYRPNDSAALSLDIWTRNKIMVEVHSGTESGSRTDADTESGTESGTEDEEEEDEEEEDTQWSAMFYLEWSESFAPWSGGPTTPELVCMWRKREDPILDVWTNARAVVQLQPFSSDYALASWSMMGTTAHLQIAWPLISAAVHVEAGQVGPASALLPRELWREVGAYVL